MVNFYFIIIPSTAEWIHKVEMAVMSALFSSKFSSLAFWRANHAGIIHAATYLLRIVRRNGRANKLKHSA